MTGRGFDRRLIVLAGIAAIVAATLSTVGLAAVGGAFDSNHGAPNRRCSPPGLQGTVVDVGLINMGGRMPMMGGGMGGTMRLITDRQTVPAGAVSFRVGNVGSLVHEFVVLPLDRGASPGERPIGTDGRVDENGSLGEASRNCASGAGDGINPGAIGWLTVNLPAGDYELICNLPGHYAAGMYTTLRVSN